MKARRRYSIVISLALVIASGSYLVSHARGIPTVTPLFYSGLLEDENGPINGSKSIVIRIFDAPSSGNEVCSSSPSAPTQLTAGRFRVALDTTCVAAVNANSDLWVEVSADSQTLPRTKIGAVPYALVAQDATGDIHPNSVTVNGVKVINSDGTLAVGAVPRIKAIPGANVNVSGTGTPVQLNQLPITVPPGGGDLLLNISGSCAMYSNTTGFPTAYLVVIVMDDPTATPLAGAGSVLTIPNGTASQLSSLGFAATRAFTSVAAGNHTAYCVATPTQNGPTQGTCQCQISAVFGAGAL